VVNTRMQKIVNINVIDELMLKDCSGMFE